MRFVAVFKILGILLMILSLSMLPPIFVSLYYHDHAYAPFVETFCFSFGCGFLLWLFCRSYTTELKTRDGFLVVTLFWTVLSLFAALPFFINMFPRLGFTDALFEAVSGLTTTGASVFYDLEILPRAILYYRQQLHFLGGMGIIVLALAILPMLGIGGMQLYRAETVGPLKTTKLRPRLTQTAKALWMIYTGLVVLCALSYWLAGMRPFDAIGESFSTVSTGGFSIHSTSFAYYHSAAIDMIAVIFMLLGATNFALHFQYIHTRSLSVYWQDREWLAYLKLLGIVIIICLATLLIYHRYHFGEGLLQSIFITVSLSTTTGFTTTDFSLWPTFLPIMLMVIAIMGGCGGSTSGGIKIIRCLLLKKQGGRELKRLIHPHAVITLKLGKQVLPEEIIQSIWAFVAIFVFLYVVLFLLLMASGVNMLTAFGALTSCLSNTGASIGNVSDSFRFLPVFSKWVLIFAMIAGRLEIFTLLVLFMPHYWRK